MSYVLRVCAFFCLLSPVCELQAQTSASSGLIAVQVEKAAAEQGVGTTDVSREASVTTEAEPVATAAAAEAPAAAKEMVTTKGRVLNELNKPLAGVVVFAKDVAAIASTNADGEYSLLVPAGVNTLSFSYAGYEEQQLRASNFLPTTVQLLPVQGKKKLAKASRR
ncbi:carboxypeptidase-like regulatory domain-containing protein [Hymenobacter metallicola]|uniref:Carboxypeptidase-like regulatory domain-containing protein n=1 Tax=Hymenobacter metallicola TaxID=2563114 RepID=A0A4Z0QHU4_9BACT|nr:carboxypeptidase-like regulatory domain-containing protein [Hymenobacter metallicola]TGE29056.1 hypothetical protein E5K02_06265 [Hymenobacter metallicola]